MLILFFILILGLISGSFISMLTYRLPRGLSFSGRSFCDNCKQKIPWHNNIPLFYYLFSGGKSICCQKKISLRYPIIEITTALFFVFTYILFEDKNLLSFLSMPFFIWWQVFGDLAYPFFLISTFFLLTLSIIDLEFGILPDILLKFLSVPVFLFLLLSPSPGFFNGIFFGFISFCFFLAIYLITQKKGMGFGDVKMSFLLGALLGFNSLISWLFLSFIGGALIGILLLLLNKAKLGKPIPFGPFLIFSYFISFFFGDLIFSWYTILLVKGF